MAIELLKGKGDINDLGINWTQGFLRRHPDLKSRFVPLLDKDRVVAEDPDQIQRYFELFQATKAKYNIHDDDVYNMDKKGVMMGVIAKLRVVVSRKNKKPYMTQQGKREWVSLIECISLDGRVLSPFVIFKCKALLKDWYKNFPGGHIAASNRGWTDDELCLEWFQRCFDPETEKTRKGEYRMLLFDGHGSHVTRAVAQFCEEKKIVLLCLPSHSTHLLQPCDVGAFGPLAESYRKHLLQETKWGASYSIDKLEFLQILLRARADSLNTKNIISAWRKTGLFPFDPEVVIGALPAVRLAREKAAAEAQQPPPPPPQPSSRPTTSGRPAPLVIKTPQNVADVNALIKVSNEIKEQLAGISTAQEQMQTHIQNLQLCVQKLGNSATTAITETKLTQSVNQELIEQSCGC
jgi:hypothetical protein